jgi:N,N'-diacetylbacillosaminyl-diphospho-undecaprenol alpha-1,3-N-acetylgalactosaminyltransferase
MVQFRGGLISHLVSRGHRVTVVVPSAGPYRAALEELGAEVVEMLMSRFVAPLRDLLLIGDLIRFFATHRFDIVHTMTIKPNLYAAPIARLLATPRVVGLVSGAGFLLAEDGLEKRPTLSALVRLFLRGSFASMQKVWFQNADDLAHFMSQKICRSGQGVVIRGGGVDVNRYAPLIRDADLGVRKRAGLGVPQDCGMVLMGAARFIGAKGVREFAHAAAIVLRDHDNWRFVLVAPDDPGSPDSVDRAEACFQVPGLIIPEGFRHDLDEITAASDIVVLPSYYPEGVPRFLLEGMACGKPIVTTDHTGCRETVEAGVNGLLVPVRNANALAAAIKTLIESPELRRRFGDASRALVEKEFSQEVVCRRILEEVYEIGGARKMQGDSSC